MRDKIYRKLLIISFFIIPLITIFFVSCKSGIKPEDLSSSNTIYLPYISEEPLLLDPLKTRNDIIRFLFEPLLDVNEKGDIVPSVIESWNSSSDGLVWTFNIYRDILWSDGKPLVADDILFTFNYLKDPSMSPYYSTFFYFIDTLEKTDDFTFQVKLKERYTPFLSLLTEVFPVPADLYKDGSVNPFLPVNGPFTFLSSKEGSYICLTRNKNYRKDMPEIENIVFRIYKNKEDVFKALLSGQVDMDRYLQAEEYLILGDDYKEYSLYTCPGQNYTSLGFNFKDEIFSDVRVRKAIAYGIDRELILTYLLHDMGEIATGPLYSFSDKWYSKGESYPFKPEKSEKLLEEAGWIKGEKGFFEKDGKPLYFKLSTYKGDPLRERVVTTVQQFFGEIGVLVETEFLEWNEFINLLYSGSLQCWCVDLYENLSDPHNMFYSYFYSEKIPEKGGNNYGFYHNDRVDEIILLAGKEEDYKKRFEDYKRLQNLISKDLPVIFLYHRNSLTGINKRIELPKGTEPVLFKPYGDFCKWKILK